MQVRTDEKKIEELLTRGVENVIPRDLARKKLQSGEQLRVYFGVDPTGAKLHLGHSIPLRKLSAFSDLGHHVIFVVGSFTAMVGDPSGRDAMREPLTEAEVRENFATYQEQARKIIDFSKIEVRYNDEWLAPLALKDLMHLAAQFTIQQMLKRDMFQRRLQENKPISVLEFLYPLMVGYDSAVLDVDGELGGSDQEFNMLAGRHVQQFMHKRDKFVLTTKLIEGLDGRKMSKTYDNCVYLQDEPADMYGKLMSVRDDLVLKYFETCTDLSMRTVEEIMAGHPKEAKLRLAREITARYHDEEAAKKAQEGWINIFSKKEFPEDAPVVERSAEVLLVDVMAEALGESKTNLRRLIQQRAIEDDGEAIIDPLVAVIKDRKLRVGNHRFLKIIAK